jgi:RNA polymerase sigma-70 factor (ECF subfamily)
MRIDLGPALDAVGVCALPVLHAPSIVAFVMGASEQQARLRWMIDQYLELVARILRNAGCPETEIDDDVQRTFIIAANRIDDVRPGAERSFLLQIALRVAAHARRSAARRREVLSEDGPEIISLATPEELTDQKRARQLLDQVLGQMKPDLRTVFVLFEVEEMSMGEIARILALPVGTVASRLRRARIDFHSRVSAFERLSEVGS